MHIPQRSTHASRLERFLGPAEVARISEAARDWYGPPIALAGVPGRVYARAGGDFVGPIEGGGFGNGFDYWREQTDRKIRALLPSLDRWAKREAKNPSLQGFLSLSGLINALTDGNRWDVFFNKVGVAGATGFSNTLWFVGNTPQAGSVGGGSGAACDDATTGAFPFQNAATGTQHFVTGEVAASVAPNTLLLYDRLWHARLINPDGLTVAISTTPTRYQSTVVTNPDFVGGNFLFCEVNIGLGVTAHNWTVVNYQDQADAASVVPSIAGIASCAASRLDHAGWFIPLASGDYGIRDVTQLQCSTSITGTVNFVIGHPLAFLPCFLANTICIRDGINSAASLARVFDDACLAFLEINKPAATATTYTGQATLAYG